MPDVFISYSRRDLEFVKELHAALVSRDKDIWVDWEDIPITAEWLAEVFQGIESSDNFLFVLTPDSLRSDVCARELAHALDKTSVSYPCYGGKPSPDLSARSRCGPELDVLPSGGRLPGGRREPRRCARHRSRLGTCAHPALRPVARVGEARQGPELSPARPGPDDAEQWTAARSAGLEPQPTPLQLEYVLASRNAATRRQRITVSAALVAVGVAASLALLAWLQRNEAVEQQAVAERQARLSLSRQLAAQSEAVLARDPEQSLSSPPAGDAAATDEGLATSSAARCAALACAR